MNYHYILPIISVGIATAGFITVWRLTWLTKHRYKTAIADQQKTIAMLEQAFMNKMEMDNNTLLHVDDANSRLADLRNLDWYVKPDAEQPDNRPLYVFDDYNKTMIIGDEPLEIIDIRPGEHGIQKYNIYAKLVRINSREIIASATLPFILRFEFGHQFKIINYENALIKCFEFYNKMANELFDLTTKPPHHEENQPGSSNAAINSV